MVGWASSEVPGKPGAQTTTVIGSAAEAGGGAEACGEVEPLRRALVVDWEDASSTEPGADRAQAACRVRGRLAIRADAWIAAAHQCITDPGSRRQLADEAEAMGEVFEELRELCVTVRTRDPEPIEGSLHGVGYEVERLAGVIARLTRR